MSNRHGLSGWQSPDHRDTQQLFFNRSHDDCVHQHRSAADGGNDRSFHRGHEGEHWSDGGDNFPFHQHHGSNGDAGEFHSASPAHQVAAELGWGDAAWGDAGGFEAVLISGLTGAIPFGGNLEVNNNSFIQNTAIDNTSILLNAMNGGTVDIGGNVDALSSQQVANLFQGMTDASHTGGGETALLGQMNGGFLPAGSSIVIVPIDHLEINNNTYVQNTLVENTQIGFNAANGGTIDVGGSVNALGSQALVAPHDALQVA
jgi:hypothetical protein